MKASVNRVAGQAAGIQRMVEESRCCVDILNQIAAARSALDALGVELLTRRLESRVLSHGTGGEHENARTMSKDDVVAKVRTVLSRFLG